MGVDVLDFQEEALSLCSVPDLQDVMVRAMTSLDLPYFTYAWSRSRSLDRLDMAEDSFFTTMSGEFFAAYLDGDLYKHDYSIHACRGTTTIPSLVGRPYHRWRKVPSTELKGLELAVEDLGREYFVDGLTGRIENHDGLFFAGASVIGQDMTLREFEGALVNAGTAFQLLRIYHDRFHQLRRPEPTMTITQAEFIKLASLMRSGNFGDAEGQIAELVRMVDGGSPPAFDHSPGYEWIVLRGRTFHFGPIQTRIIALLDEARRAGQGWVLERDVMDKSKARSRNIHDIFRRHDRAFLFEFDGFGRVRIRM